MGNEFASQDSVSEADTRVPMSRLQSEERALEYTPILKGEDAQTAQRRRHRISLPKVTLFAHDLIMANLAFNLSAWVSGSIFPTVVYPTERFLLFVFSLIVLAFFPTYRLYNLHLVFSKRTHLVNLLKAFVWGFLTLGITTLFCSHSYLLEGPVILFVICLGSVCLLLLSRIFSDYLLNILSSLGISFLSIGVLGLMNFGKLTVFMENWVTIPAGFLFALFIVSASRSLLVHVVLNNWMRRYFRTQVVIVGSDKEAELITNHIIIHNAPFWIAGFVTAHKVHSLDLRAQKGRLGEIKDLPPLVKARKIDEIIVTDEGIDKKVLISLLDYCTSEGVTVWFPPKLMPIIHLKLHVDTFCGLPMIRLCSQKNSYVFNKVKYCFDAVVVAPMLFLLLPLFLLIGIAIKLNSPGPVFYKARALGIDGLQFILYKFRSMHVDTDCEIHKNYVTDFITGGLCQETVDSGVFKITNDQRVSSVGRFLRSFSLDELPQLINVLRGEMSLVGPRPCLPYEYEVYKDWHKKRLSIRPGITGIWQVAGRSAVSFEDMVLLDLYYIYNRSFWVDVSILYETLFAVLGKRGAY